MISKLLGPINKPIFEILYRSAYRACFQLEPDISLQPFTTLFVRLAKSEKLKVEKVDQERNMFLVEKMAWLKVIGTDQDLKAVRTEALSRLLYVNDVKGTFILVCSNLPRWGWAQVSQGARMKAQACRQAETNQNMLPQEIKSLAGEAGPIPSK